MGTPDRSDSIAIGIVGDRDPARDTHAATEAALTHAAAAASVALEVDWLPTEALIDRPIERFAGFLVAPGSPYRSVAGALHAIRFAREHRRPLLATCGGFQHVVLEFVRNVLGERQAWHAEYDADPFEKGAGGEEVATRVVEPLACSLVGAHAAVDLEPGSAVTDWYGTGTTVESFRCSYGAAARFVPRLERAGLAVTGTGPGREPRILELRAHPFFVATLFVPQCASTPARPHPLVMAFVAAARRSKGTSLACRLALRVARENRDGAVAAPDRWSADGAYEALCCERSTSGRRPMPGNDRAHGAGRCRVARSTVESRAIDVCASTDARAARGRACRSSTPRRWPHARRWNVPAQRTARWCGGGS